MFFLYFFTFKVFLLYSWFGTAYRIFSRSHTVYSVYLYIYLNTLETNIFLQVFGNSLNDQHGADTHSSFSQHQNDETVSIFNTSHLTRISLSSLRSHGFIFICRWAWVTSLCIRPFTQSNSAWAAFPTRPRICGSGLSVWLMRVCPQDSRNGYSSQTHPRACIKSPSHPQSYQRCFGGWF